MEWKDLRQEEKFDIMRDYVRRGFKSLDDIVNDFNAEQVEGLRKKPSSPSPLPPASTMHAIHETFRDWFGGFE